MIRGGGAPHSGDGRGAAAKSDHCSDTGSDAPPQVTTLSGSRAVACTPNAMEETSDGGLSAVPIKAKSISSAAHAAMTRP